MKTEIEREREYYLRHMLLDVGSREVLRQLSDSLSKRRRINYGCCCGEEPTHDGVVACSNSSM